MSEKPKPIEETGLTGNAVIQYRETSGTLVKDGSCVNYIAVRTS